MLVPNRTQPPARHGFLIELKYLKAGATDEAVAKKLAEADEQLRRYLTDPKLHSLGGPEGWKAVSIAFVGTEACWLNDLGGEVRKITA